MADALGGRQEDVVGDGGGPVVDLGENAARSGVVEQVCEDLLGWTACEEEEEEGKLSGGLFGGFASTHLSALAHPVQPDAASARRIEGGGESNGESVGLGIRR